MKFNEAIIFNACDLLVQQSHALWTQQVYPERMKSAQFAHVHAGKLYTIAVLEMPKLEVQAA